MRALQRKRYDDARREQRRIAAPTFDGVHASFHDGCCLHEMMFFCCAIDAATMRHDERASDLLPLPLFMPRHVFHH